MQCPHCLSKRRITELHIHNCARRPSDRELIRWRQEGMTRDEIVEKIKQRDPTGEGVSRHAVTQWLRKMGETFIRRRPYRRVLKKDQLRAYLLSSPGVKFTYTYLMDKGYNGSTIQSVIKQMEGDGELRRVDGGYLVIGERRVELTNPQKLRKEAIWPPLETYQGELWMEAQRERNGKRMA